MPDLPQTGPGSLKGALPGAGKSSASRDDDLFKESTMTFGEHLDELRKCLVLSLLGIIAAFIIVLLIGGPGWTVEFIQGPLGKALRTFYLDKAEEDVKSQLAMLRESGARVPDYEEVEFAISQQEMVPSVHYFHPRGLVDDLRRDSTFAKNPGLRFPEFSPADFLSADEKKKTPDGARLFCRLVYQQQQSEAASPGKRIWELLDDKTRQLIESAAEKPETDPLPDKDKQELARAIETRIVDVPDGTAKFYRAGEDGAVDEAFQIILDNAPTLAVTEAQQRQVAQAEKLKRVLERREDFSPTTFNRLLLAIAYPQCVAAGPHKGSMTSLVLWRGVDEDPRVSVKTLNAHEAFMIFIKAAIIVSLVFASPWVFYQIWSFVAAGLYPHEKRYVHIFAPFSLVLFLGGVSLCFFFVFEYVLNFLFWFNKLMNIDPDIRISEWFGFALFLPLGFGVAFQLPLVMLLLERIGIMSVATYTSKWRVSVLVICVISMLLTPADPTSMVLMAAPLTVLYFGGILLCKFMPRGRNPFRQPAADV